MFLCDKVWLCLCGVTLGILLRCCTMLYPYSGQGKPPMFGDYEAQRHWMEVTVNLPVGEWYHNSSRNDLQYWGLDYPPFTAYHSYFCGLIAKFLNGSYVELRESRGFESPAHKLFMRYTVLLADLLVYFPSIVIFFMFCNKLNNSNLEYKPKKKVQNVTTHITPEFSVILGLISPGLILIDHGHFQYNCVSLGFAVLAVSALIKSRYLLASTLFCLALNYKQMELYHALPFFMFLLSSCIPKPGQSALSGILRLANLALTVIITFGILWSPFLFQIKDLLQVIHRLFPVARGIFEDKVANIWCTINIFYKLKNYCNYDLLRYSTMITLAANLPSLTDLFLRPNAAKFIPALINSSLAFFLCSFQVHEKTILLAVAPVILYLPNKPIPCFWFTYISTFSMLPLFIKDKLLIPYFALTALYVVAFISIFNHLFKIDNKRNFTSSVYNDAVTIIIDLSNRKQKQSVVNNVMKIWTERKQNIQNVLLHFFLMISFIGSVVITVTAVAFNPPSKYPDLFTLFVCTYSCVHFVGFFLYFNVVQMLIPQSFPVPHLKPKLS